MWATGSNILMCPVVTRLSSSVNGNSCSSITTVLDKYKVGKVIGDGNFAVVKDCVERYVNFEYYISLHLIDGFKTLF